MPQYEPKTDSREFEVANPDQYPSARSDDTPEVGTEIAIRLWSANRADRRVPLTWKSDSVLVYMIADLVGASGGRVAEAGLAGMAAQFDGSRQALVAAKRIQTSTLEFVACRPGERIGAAILIYQPRSSDLTGFSGELVQLALEKAKPGQILVADSVSRRLRDLPGIEFRTDAAVTGDESTGPAELIWTTPERLAELQNSVGDEAEPQTAEPRGSASQSMASPVGATSMVHSPFARGTSSEAVPPVTGTGNFAGKDVAATASQRTGQISNRTERAPAFEGFQQSAGSTLADGLDEFGERPLITRTRVILGAVAVVLVTVLIVVLFRPTPVAKHPKPLPLQPDQTVGTDGSEKRPPAAIEPDATKPPAEPANVKPLGKASGGISQPKTPGKATADNRAKGKKDTPEEPPLPSEIGGFSVKDIPKLLGMAQKDAGQGNYVNARKEYSTILQLQPGNQDAKEGLHRLEIIQK